MRASHDTREETLARLRRGYLTGRLRTETFALRVDSALQAASREQLQGLTADLPSVPPTRLARLRALLGPPRLGLPPAAELRGGRLTLGRSRACQLLLGDDTVSRRHAELRVQDGRWFVRDLDSANGTYVNGRRVIDAEVRRGDVIQLGGCKLRI